MCLEQGRVHHLTSLERSQDVMSISISLELIGNHARVSGKQQTTTPGRIKGGSICKVMHGQYGLL